MHKLTCLNINTMTTERFLEIARDRMSRLNDVELKKAIVMLNDRLDDVSDMLIDLGLQILSCTVSESEFIEFCDTL